MDILHRVATDLCAQSGHEISKRTLGKHLPKIGIHRRKFRNDETGLNIAQRHAACDVLTGKQTRLIFATSSIGLGIDAMQNQRLKGALEALRECKIDVGWEESAPSATALGYVETFQPESAARNMTSVLEYVEAEMESGSVLNGDGYLFENMFIEIDGGHGPREKAARFCAGLLFHILDLNVLHFFANSGGCSRWATAEQVNGAIAVRINGVIFWVDPVAYLNADDKEKYDILFAELLKMCAIANGASFRQTASGVRVCAARGPTTLPTIDADDVHEFLNGTDNFRAGFTATPSGGYTGSELGELFRRVHRQMDDVRCFQVTCQTMTWRKHPDVHDMQPIRGDSSLLKFLDLFGGFFPQPRLSEQPHLQPGVDTPSGSYMPLDERIRTASADTLDAVDALHPRLLFDAAWPELQRRIVRCEDGSAKEFEPDVMDKLTKTLRCSPEEIMEEVRKKLASAARIAAEKIATEEMRATGHYDALLEFVAEHSANGKARKPELVALLKERRLPSRQRMGSKITLLQKLQLKLTTPVTEKIGNAHTHTHDY